MGNQQWPTRSQLRQEAFLPSLSAVSGSSSAEEGCTDVNPYCKTLCIPSLKNRVAPGWISWLLFGVVETFENRVAPGWISWLLFGVVETFENRVAPGWISWLLFGVVETFENRVAPGWIS